MDPLATTAATLALFFAPGLLLVAALGGARQRIELSLGEQVFLSLAASLIFSGWVGLVLAELGLFSPARLALAVGGVVLGAALAARKRLNLRAGRLQLDEALAIVCLSGFALAVYFPPFEYVMGGKDPGVYLNAGFHVARQGNIRHVDPLVKDIPPQARELFFREGPEISSWSQPRYLGYYLESPASGLVLPQGFHLYPVWIGSAAGLYEMKAGLYVTPFFAMVGLLGLFFAARRLWGFEVAGWASGLLAVFQIQVWFARFPNSEMLVQFLFATGLLSFYFMQEKRSTLGGALAGAALGSTLLVRLDAILFLVPVGFYLAWVRLRREWGRPESGFLAVFVLFVFHAGLHARLLSWPYVSSVFERWYWRSAWENLPLLSAAALAAFLILDRLAPRVLRRALPDGGSRRLGALAAAAVFALAGYAYFIRPLWHHPRTAPHDAESFLRMGWYLYPMGLALAVGGMMILLGRWQRRSTLFLLAALTFSGFFFYKIRVSNDHFFCMRRFIPVILPSVLVAIGIFLATLRTAGGRAGRWASPLIGALLALVYLADGRPLWKHMEFRGSLAFIQNLARLIGDQDVVLFPRMEGLHLLELPLAELHGKKVLEFYTLKPDKKKIEELMRKWRGRYGDLYFVTNYKISLSGFFTRHVADFWLASEKYEYTYTRPPSRAEPFHLRFTLSKAVDLEELARQVPKLPFVDVGGSDDPLVAWFHEKEREAEASFRWSQRTSAVFLPALGPQSREVVLRLAGRREALAPPAEVQVSVNDRPLQTLSPGPRFEIYRLSLPPEVTAPLESELPVLRLDTRTWRPADFIPGATDIRDLGVRLDWIEVR